MYWVNQQLSAQPGIRSYYSAILALSKLWQLMKTHLIRKKVAQTFIYSGHHCSSLRCVELCFMHGWKYVKPTTGLAPGEKKFWKTTKNTALNEQCTTQNKRVLNVMAGLIFLNTNAHTSRTGLSLITLILNSNTCSHLKQRTRFLVLPKGTHSATSRALRIWL